MQYVTIKIYESKLDEFIKHYQQYSTDNNGEYILFFAKSNSFVVTVYKNAKNNGQYKVVFNGKNSLIEAQKWNQHAFVNEKKVSKESTHFVTYEKQYGSDEVGFGDFFGPLVVVSCYLDETIFKSISDLTFKDSKKLDDAYILQVGPLLAHKVKHVLNIVDNEKLNDLTSKGYNMNKIKAMLHVNVLNKLKNQLKIDAVSFIDQFASEQKFKEYTASMVGLTNYVLREKGESYYPSVALASVLARYYFLVEIEKLNKKYQTSFPLGASSLVDTFASEFLKKHGITVLNSICKKNFKNYLRLTA